MDGEQRVGMLGAEVTPVGRIPGLQQHRMPLRRCRRGGHTTDGELRTPMVDQSRLTRFVPAVPELACHGDELLGPVVPVGVVQEAAAPEVLACEGVGRGDHVPAGPSVREMVQRSELPCHIEGFVEGGVDGAHQPKPFGDGAEGGQHCERIGPAHHVEVMDSATVLTQSQPLRQEEEVEKSTLSSAGQMHEGGKIDLTSRGGIRPHRGVVDSRKMRSQVNGLAVLAFPNLNRIRRGAHQISPHSLAMSS